MPYVYLHLLLVFCFCWEPRLIVFIGSALGSKETTLTALLDASTLLAIKIINASQEHHSLMFVHFLPPFLGTSPSSNLLPSQPFHQPKIVLSFEIDSVLEVYFEWLGNQTTNVHRGPFWEKLNIQILSFFASLFSRREYTDTEDFLRKYPRHTCVHPSSSQPNQLLFSRVNSLLEKMGTPRLFSLHVTRWLHSSQQKEKIQWLNS